MYLVIVFEDCNGKGRGIAGEVIGGYGLRLVWEKVCEGRVCGVE